MPLARDAGQCPPTAVWREICLCCERLKPGRPRELEQATRPRLPMMDSTCLFCSGDGGFKVYDDGRCRVVIADEPFAGFCRVVWNAHVREMTDLAATERDHLMRIVFAVEAALRALVSPHKINLASLGNVVPHLHWHVIPRFESDSHFPNPVWGAPKRRSAERMLPPNFAAQLSARLAEG